MKPQKRTKLRRPTQWLGATQTYAGSAGLVTAGVSNGVVSSSMVDTSTAATALGDPALDRFTIMRIVGDLGLVVSTAFNASTTGFLHYGIIAVQVGDVAAAQYSPGSSNSADAQWLHLRHLHLTFPNGNINPAVDGHTGLYGPALHLDIKQKRVLRPNMRLLMLSQWVTDVGAPTAGVLSLSMFLRSLIARAI